MKSPKEALCIKSYLATQDLEHTKLILWSDVDLSNNQLIAPRASRTSLTSKGIWS